MDRHCRLASEKMQGTHSTTTNHIQARACPKRLWFGCTIMPSHMHSDRTLIVTRASLCERCRPRRIVAAPVIRQHCPQQKSHSPQDQRGIKDDT